MELLSLFFSEMWKLLSEPTPIWLTITLAIIFGSALDAVRVFLRKITEQYLHDHPADAPDESRISEPEEP